MDPTRLKAFMVPACNVRIHNGLPVVLASGEPARTLQSVKKLYTSVLAPYFGMRMSDIPFGTTDWSTVPTTTHPGEPGTATWRTRQFGMLRVRMVEYSAGYRADHWCEKGHILLCMSGELETELKDGRRFVLRPGMSYQVADGAEPHRSSTRSGATLFIVD
jgi:hypothetical protein